MFSVYNEVAPPSGVETSLFGDFSGEGEQELLITKASRLELYRVEQQPKPHLKLLASESLFGNVVDTAIVPLSGKASKHSSGRLSSNAILLSFAPVKLSLLVFDSYSQTFRTLGLLNFEENATGVGSSVRVFRKSSPSRDTRTALPLIFSDPENRCLAMTCYDDQLVVLPSRHGAREYPDLDELLGMTELFDGEGPRKRQRVGESKGQDKDADEDSGSEGGDDNWALGGVEGEALALQHKAQSQMERITSDIFDEPWVLYFPALGIEGEIRSIGFLQGYKEPTIAVLNCKPYTDPSLAAFESFTCSVYVLSLDISSRKTTVIWTTEGLPHDSTRLEPVPAPIGGLLVFSASAAVYLDQRQSLVLGVNGYAKLSVDTQRFRLPPTLATPHTALDTAVGTWISPRRYVLVARDGHVRILSLDSAAGGAISVDFLNLSGCGLSVGVATCCSTLPYPTMGVFIGSRLSDSRLLALRSGDRTAGPAAPAPIPQRESEPEPEPEEEYDEDDAFLYNTESTMPKAPKEEEVKAMEEFVAEDAEDVFLYGSGTGKGSDMQMRFRGTASSVLARLTSYRATGEVTRDQLFFVKPVEELLYQLEETDVLPSIAPFVDTTVGEAPLWPTLVKDRLEMASNDEDSEANGLPPLPWELTGACGGHSTGGIASVTQGLRLTAVTEIPLPGCCGLFFLSVPPSDGEVPGAAESRNGIMILSFPRRSRVLIVRGDAMQEIKPESVNFPGAAVLYAAELKDNKFLILTKHGMRVYVWDRVPPGEKSASGLAFHPKPLLLITREEKEASAISLGFDSDTHFRYASSAGRFALLQDTNNKVHVLDTSVMQETGAVSSRMFTHLTAACLFEDVTGLLAHGLYLKTPKAAASVYVVGVTTEGHIQIWTAAPQTLVFDSSTRTHDPLTLSSNFPEDLDTPNVEELRSGTAKEHSTDIFQIQVCSIDRESYVNGYKLNTPSSKGTTACIALSLLYHSGDLRVFEFLPRTKDQSRGPDDQSAKDSDTQATPISKRKPTLARTPGQQFHSLSAEASKAASGFPRFKMVAHTLITRPPPRIVAKRVAASGEEEGDGEGGGSATYKRVLMPGVAFPSPNGTFRPAQLINLASVCGWSGVLSLTAMPTLTLNHASAPLPVKLQVPDLSPGPGPGFTLGLLSEQRASALKAETAPPSTACTIGQRPSDSYPVRAAVPFGSPGCPAGLAVALPDRILLSLLPASRHTTLLSSTAVAKVTRIGASIRHLRYLRWGSRPVTRADTGSEAVVPAYVAAVSRPVRHNPKKDQEGEKQRVEQDGPELSQLPRFHTDYGNAVQEMEPFPVDTAHELHLYMRRQPWEEATALGAPSHALRGHIRLLEVIKLERDEHVLSIAEMRLSQSPGSRPEPMLIVGTGFVRHRGENYRAQGRILVFRIQHINMSTGDIRCTKATAGSQEGGTKERTWKSKGLNGSILEAPGSSSGAGTEDAQESRTIVPSLRLITAKKTAGAVTALTSLATKKRRYVLAAVGLQVFVHQWDGEVLIECGFLHTGWYTTALASAGPFIFVGDITRGCNFALFREEDNCVEPLAADPGRNIPVTAAATLVHGRSLGLMVADEDKNVSIFRYNMKDYGDELEKVGDMHVGATTNHIAPLQLLPVGYKEARVGAVFGTLDGGVGTITPLSETDFKVLLVLQKLLNYVLPHVAGLNPKGYRLLQSDYHLTKARAKNIADGVLLSHYLRLDIRMQRKLAQSIGASHESVVATLRHVGLASQVF